MSAAIKVRQLADGVESELRIPFRPSAPPPQNVLGSPPGAGNVIYRGDVVVVTGKPNALNAAASVLVRNRIAATKGSFPTALPLLAMVGGRRRSGWLRPDSSAGSRFLCGGLR